MNNKWMVAFFSMVFLLATPVMLNAASPETDSSQEVVVEGRIEIFEMDASDTVTEVSLENEEMTYVVVKNNKELELIKKIGSDIRATGRVSFHGQGKRLIEITAYELINP